VISDTGVVVVDVPPTICVLYYNLPGRVGKSNFVFDLVRLGFWMDG
jgi:hypothetical protein